MSSKPEFGTHKYIGASNIWGLTKNALCVRLPGKGRSGLTKIMTQDGKTWWVSPANLLTKDKDK